MCQPASMVLTKDKVFWSKKTDHHERIIEEFLLAADGVRGPNIVRVEICPPGNKNLDAPIEEWEYQVDQDILPDWYNSEYEGRVRKELEEWYKTKVFMEGKHEVRGERNIWLFGTASAVLRGSSSAELMDSSSAELFHSSSAVLWNKSSAKLWADSSAELWNKSSAVLKNRSSAELFHSSSAVLFNSSSARLCGLSSAELWDSSLVRYYGTGEPPIPKSDFAVTINYQNSKPIKMITKYDA